MRGSYEFLLMMVELTTFVSRLALLRTQAAFSVTSWWRTAARNASVGGSPSSLHLIGFAVDLVPDDGVSREGLLACALKVGLHGIVESDHVHVQCRPLRK